MRAVLKRKADQDLEKQNSAKTPRPAKQRGDSADGNAQSKNNDVSITNESGAPAVQKAKQNTDTLQQADTPGNAMDAPKSSAGQNVTDASSQLDTAALDHASTQNGTNDHQKTSRNGQRTEEDHNGQRPENDERNGHRKENDERNGQSNEEDLNGKKPEQQDPQARKKAEEKVDAAMKLLMGMVLLVEAHRYDKETKNCAEPSEKQEHHLGQVCELATQPGIAENRHLSKISIKFFPEIEKLNQVREQRKVLEEELNRCLDEVRQAGKAISAALVKRTKHILSQPDVEFWPEAVIEQNQLVDKARNERKDAEKKCNELREAIQPLRSIEHASARLPLFYAEEGLLKMALLQGPAQISPSDEDSEEETSQEGGRQDDRHRHERHSDEQNAEERSQEFERHFSGASGPNDHHGRGRQEHRRHEGGRRRSRRGRSARQDVPPSDERPKAPARTMQDLIHDAQRNQLNFAKGVRSDCSRIRREHQRGYKRELSKFLRQKKEGEILGTKTDFDHDYFLEQTRVTMEIGIAERRIEFAEKAAKITGAIRREEMTSDFGDWSNDGGDSNSNRSGPVWDLDKEIIETWRLDEKQKDVSSASNWRAEERDSGGESIVSASSRDHVYDVATDKPGARIRRWQEHQEKLRASSQLAGLPLGADEIFLKSQSPSVPWVDEG